MDPANGHEFGTQRRGSPLYTLAPYGNSPTEHGTAVLAYFESCGLPTNEVGGVLPRVGSLTVGQAGQAFQEVGPKSYYSAVTRAVQGIPIRDSVAWARMDVNGDVLREEVYWPSIPQGVIDNAVALQTQISTASGLAAYQSALPAGAGQGSVVIRHSSAWAPRVAPFEAYAVYDVTTSDGHGSSSTIHYDAQGIQVQLPQEKRSGAPESTNKQ
jgi:hypothetical protein